MGFVFLYLRKTRGENNKINEKSLKALGSFLLMVI